MANNKGKVFEKDFQDAAKKQGLWILRLNDTSLSWEKEKSARFTPNNICDFIIYRKPNLFLIECKSTAYKTFSIQPTPEDSKGMIQAHQISDLINFGMAEGVYAGFVFNFRSDKDINEDCTYWLSIDNFSQFLVDLNRKSIGETHVAQYRGIAVEQTKKRTHFTYDINKMLDDIVNQGKQKGGTDGSTL